MLFLAVWFCQLVWEQKLPPTLSPLLSHTGFTFTRIRPCLGLCTGECTHCDWLVSTETIVACVAVCTQTCDVTACIQTEPLSSQDDRQIKKEEKEEQFAA